MADGAAKEQNLTAGDWYKQGLAHKNKQQYLEAERCFSFAIKTKPDFTEALEELVKTQEKRGAVREAAASYKQLLSRQPANKQIQKRFDKLANNMQRMNQHYQQGVQYFQQQDLQKAAQSFEKARNVLPAVPEVLNNLALCLYQIGKADQAHHHITSALQKNPHYADGWVTLGNIELQRGNKPAAQEAYKQAITNAPNHLNALLNLAGLLKQQKQHSDAIEAYKAALTITPDQPSILSELHQQYHMLHRWNEAKTIKDKLIRMLGDAQKMAAPPFSLLALDDPSLQCVNAQLCSTQRYPLAQAYDASIPLPSADKNTWRIGYLSSDFHDHATAYLIAELFEQHDKTQFEIFAYSAGPDKPCKQRTRIMQAATVFRDVSNMNGDTVAHIMKDDALNILVDLKGHTNGNLLGALATRPAPIQMHYLGYPGTTGYKAIDYFIADSITAPEGSDKFYTECVIRLPHSYQINDRKRPLPEGNMTRSACGLPESGFVFCNFNQSYKITEEMFALWMEILSQTDGSVLWLLEYNDEATKNIKNHAHAHGIDPARIIMAPHKPLAEHLARYPLADLVLDSFPICSHTTASDALWCGTPILTLAGKTFASRVAASLLHAIGHAELITDTPSNYKHKALKLAKEPKQLESLKKQLVETRMKCPLFDSIATTRALEAAYLHAIRLHQNTQMPQAFALSPDLSIL